MTKAWNVFCAKKHQPQKVYALVLLKYPNMIQDFCPLYADSTINALYYNIFVCPHCGFSYS
ncbi:DUF2225 domain-containing protein, partial [Peribacillus sp. NPDC060186]